MVLLELEEYFSGPLKRIFHLKTKENFKLVAQKYLIHII